MGDMGDMYRDWNKKKKSDHAKWKEANLKILRASNIPFKERPESCLFREEGKPLVDFFPSTGRWRLPRENKNFRGGAKAFLTWYNRQ